MNSASLVVTVLVSCLVLMVTGQEALEFAKAFAKSNNVFGWNVYKELKENSGNILLSPFSLHSVLAMLQSGSRGGTADEIRNVLALPQDEYLLKLGDLYLMFYMNKTPSNTTVRVANKLYTNGGIKEEYVNYVKGHFHSEAEQIDFGKPEAKEIINNWVEEKTNKRIKNLIGTLGSDTQMLLVNALYFQGRWVQPFITQLTSDREFYRSKDVKGVVKMMSGKMTLPYIDNGDYQVIRMPYKGGFNMFVFLPRDVEGVSKLEDMLPSLDWDKLNLGLSTPHSRRVNVVLPKFTIESTWDLVEPLRKLGMETTLGLRPDFFGISNDTNLVVNGIVQKTFINVTEEGTEAAAATAGEIVAVSGMMDLAPVPEFKADHPFIFVLQHDTTKANLFIGRFSQPS